MSPPHTIESLGVEVANIKEVIGEVKTDVKEVKDIVSKNYVTKDQFEPVRNIVYGMVAAILLAVLTALIFMVVKGVHP
jgi:hypothetical protein